MQVTLFVQQSDKNLKIDCRFVGIYNIPLERHLMRATNVSEFQSSLLMFHPFHPCKWWRALDSWFPFSMRTTVKLCKNTAAAYGWAIKFREPSSFD